MVASDCSAQIGLALAERFRTRLAEHRVFSGEKEIAVTASAGVAVADRSEQSGPCDLVRHADEALYQAKRSGRNAVRMHNSLEFQEEQTETARNGL